MSVAPRDPYSTLGVLREATPEEIRSSYRRMAREYHPDHNRNPGAEDRFKEVQAAYEILSDPDKRREYDEAWTVPPSHAEHDQPPGGSDDYFDYPFDLFDDAGDDAGKGRGRPVRGEDVSVNVSLKFGEAFGGIVTRVSAPIQEPCRACRGTGLHPGASYGTRRTSCARCGGVGRVRTMRPVGVRIPAGAKTGTKIRLSGKGNAGKNGGPPGDLYVVPSVEEHPLFERRGDDFAVEAPVGIAEAALGADIEVPKPAGGTARLRLPPGTQDGRRLRVRGAGAPRMGVQPRADGRSRGDLVVRVRVVVPKSLTKRSKELLEALKEDLDDDVRGELLRIARQAEASSEASV